MRLIDADDFDKCLEGAEIEATKSQKYVFSSAINTIRGNLANFPTAEIERDKPIKPDETICRSWNKQTKEAVCPRCDYFLGHIHFLGDGKKKVTYCEHCGQAIDWSEWKEGEEE